MGSFQFGAITSSAAKNVPAHVSQGPDVGISVGCVSEGNCRDITSGAQLSTVSQRHLPTGHSHQQRMSALFSFCNIFIDF